MNTTKMAKRLEQLNQRRAQVSLTLEHIEKERREAEDNTDWLDRAAYESRIELLDRLCDWYTQEGAEIDEALERIAANQYGFCVACHEAIDSQRLESFPQVAFCTACQEAREELERV